MGRARSVAITVAGHTASAGGSRVSKHERIPNIVVVAVANKLARTAWVVLQREVSYDGRLFMSP
jgi:hypothetical protein